MIGRVFPSAAEELEAITTSRRCVRCCAAAGQVEDTPRTFVLSQATSSDGYLYHQFQEPSTTAPARRGVTPGRTRASPHVVSGADPWIAGAYMIHKDYDCQAW